MIADASSPAALTEASATWGPFCDTKVVPVMNITDAVPIFQRVNAWRDSVR